MNGYASMCFVKDAILKPLFSVGDHSLVQWIFNRCSHWIGVEQVVILRGKLTCQIGPRLISLLWHELVLCLCNDLAPIETNQWPVGCHREGHLIPMGFHRRRQCHWRWPPVILSFHASGASGTSSFTYRFTITGTFTLQPMGNQTSCFFTSKLKILCWENRKSDVISQSVEKYIGISIICIESAVPLGSCYYCIPQYFWPPGNPCDYTPPSCGRLCEGHHKAFQLPGTSVLQKDNTQSNSQVTFLFKIRRLLGETEKISN